MPNSKKQECRAGFCECCAIRLSEDEDYDENEAYFGFKRVKNNTTTTGTTTHDSAASNTKRSKKVENSSKKISAYENSMKFRVFQAPLRKQKGLYTDAVKIEYEPEQIEEDLDSVVGEDDNIESQMNSSQMLPSVEKRKRTVSIQTPRSMFDTPLRSRRVDK